MELTVRDLSRDQLTELKERWYTDVNSNVSLDEIVSMNELVSDEEIIEVYEHITFTQDDFFCSMEG